MSLYYDASTVLATGHSGGSLKSTIYRDKGKLRSDPATVFALVSEATKWAEVLKEVIEKSGLLHVERKVRRSGGVDDSFLLSLPDN